MINSDIKITCKTCNRQAKASDFILDPDYRKMVCPACVKDKRSKLEKERKSNAKIANDLENLSTKPLGWDKEDEFLEKTYKKMPEVDNRPVFPSAGHNMVKYKCPKCTYPFVYKIAENKPACCPYCSDPIRKFIVRG